MNILFCYWQFPEYTKHSAALRLTEIIRLLLPQHNITIFADYRFTKMSSIDQKYRSYFKKKGVLCINGGRTHNESKIKLIKLISNCEFDISIFSHYFIYNDYASIVKSIQPNCHLILDTVDLHFLREFRQAKIYKTDKNITQYQTTLNQELAAIRSANSVWVVTGTEKKILTSNTFFGISSNIFIIPNIHRKYNESLGYDKRSGIVFIGGFKFSPNVDAIDYFIKQIYPLIEQDLANVNVNIVGSSPPKHFKNYMKKFPQIKVTGFVEDHKPILNYSRVAIAPLRFGAGMKGKIGEYLSCGVPVVTTSIGAEGFDFEGNEVVITDNPNMFAKSIVKIYKEIKIWNSYNEIGAKFISDYSPKQAKDAIESALYSIFHRK